MTDTTVTPQTIIDNSIARAKDPNKTQWSDAQLLKFLNKAYDYIHKLLIQQNSEIALSTGTITLVADTQEYSLASNLSDFWKMPPNGVYFSSVSQPLTPVMFEDKIRTAGDTTNSDPKSYYITSDYIGLVDIPTSTAVASYPTLNCRYFARNTDLTLTGSMPYKNLFNQPMAHFMDNIAFVKAELPGAEVVAIYNALEEATLEIARNRVPS